MYEFTNQFISITENLEFLRKTMMGPNAMRLTEEITSYLDIHDGMRILDLGCGSGLSTLLLTQKYGVNVVAADLWIAPTENYERFKTLGIADKAMPISVDAIKGLPFANQYFDLLISIDAYHYFGDTADMLPKITPFIKQGGYIAVVVPGLKYEFGDNVPPEMQAIWNSEMSRTLHSLPWWQELWSKCDGIEIIDSREMDCCHLAWQEWLAAYHPVVAGDIKMMEIEGGKYFNLIQLIAKVS